MPKFTIYKQGTIVYPKNVAASNIIDSTNTTLQSRLDNVGKVIPAFLKGTEIAQINGVSIKVPQEALSVNITGVIFFNTMSELLSSTQSFKDGDILETKGYYAANDGGGSRFIVISSDTVLETDNATLLQLQDGHYAEIMIPNNGILNFRLFGAKTHEMDSKANTSTDCGPYLQKYINFINKKELIYTLLIPGGIWQFSDFDIVSTIGLHIIGENSEGSVMPGKTAIVPMSGATQNYIWKISGTNITINQVFFTRQNTGLSALFTMGNAVNNDVEHKNWQTATCPRCVLIDGVSNSNFSSLYFTFASNCIDISNTTNTYFGFLNIRSSGGLFNGVRSVIRIGDNVEGVYIDYLNAEGIRGNVFYGYGTNADAPTLFILNNLQMEATHPNASDTSISNPGYDHNIGHWFVFNGKLGSKTRPCIVANISISNLSSFYYADSTSYKTMAIFGHETNVPMGFVIGNVFVIANETGPWIIYDTVEGASFTINQPVVYGDSIFYLLNASMPLIATYNKKPNILSAADCGVKVSYKNGAYSAHLLVGTNDATEYYTLHNINDTLGFRFYHLADEPTTINIQVEKYVSNTWQTVGTFTTTCSSTTGWQIATINNLGIGLPLKIRVKGLPKYVDYFTS